MIHHIHKQKTAQKAPHVHIINGGVTVVEYEGPPHIKSVIFYSADDVTFLRQFRLCCLCSFFFFVLFVLFFLCMLVLKSAKHRKGQCRCFSMSLYNIFLRKFNDKCYLFYIYLILKIASCSLIPFIV